MLAQSKRQYKAQRLQSIVVPRGIGYIWYVLFQDWTNTLSVSFVSGSFIVGEVFKTRPVVSYILWCQTSAPAGASRVAVGTDIRRDRNHMQGTKTSSTRFPDFIEEWTLPGNYYYCYFESGTLLVALKNPKKPSYHQCKRKVFFGNLGHMSPTSLQLTQPTSLNFPCSGFPFA